MEITSESSTPEPGVSSVNIDHFAARLSHLLIDTTSKSRPPKRARTSDQHTGHDSVTGSKSMCLLRWSERELLKPTTFLVLYTKGDYWAAHKDMTFWEAAGTFIQSQLHTNYCRSGNNNCCIS